MKNDNTDVMTERKKKRENFQRLDGLRYAVELWEANGQPYADDAWMYYTVSSLNNFCREFEVNFMKDSEWLESVIEPYMELIHDDPDTLLKCRMIKRGLTIE